MPGWVKYGLIGCGSLLVLFLIALFFVLKWWSDNAGDVMERTGAVLEAGKAAGRETDEQGCIDQAKAREDGGVRGMLATGIWVRGCLDTARETPRFCEGVPSPTAFRENVKWMSTQCPAGRGMDAQKCQSLMRVKQGFCNEGRPKAGVDPAVFDSLNTDGIPAPTDVAPPTQADSADF